jgi:hypothetical protein
MRFGNSAVIWAGLKEVPESAALCVVHDKVEMCRCLEGAEQVRRPWRIALCGTEEKVPFKLGKALLRIFSEQSERIEDIQPLANFRWPS